MIYNICNKNIYIIIIFILIIILIYNISIYSNKNKIEKFSSQVNTENIVNKFINKLDQKKTLLNTKKLTKKILTECDSDVNVLINKFDNDIIKLSIKNKEYGLVDSSQYNKIVSCDSSTLNNENTTSFVYNNIIYGNADNYTKNCSDSYGYTYGRISDTGFNDAESISDIITNARKETYDDCLLFYDETDTNNINISSITYNTNTWGNTKLYSSLSHNKSDITDNLTCDLTNSDIETNKDSDITIKETVWGNTNNHIKTTDITSDKFKECGIKNSEITGDTYRDSSGSGLTIIKKNGTLIDKNNCSKGNADWGHIGNKEGEYIKQNTYNTNIIDNPVSCYTNTFLINNDYIEDLNVGKISLDSHIKNSECLEIDTDTNKIKDKWGSLYHYSISTNGLWPDNFQSEIDNCANCTSIAEKCVLDSDTWDKKNIIPKSDCHIPIDDADVNIVNDSTNNWYTDDVSISKTDGDSIISSKLKEKYDSGITNSFDNCSIKYSDIYGYTNHHNTLWDTNAAKTKTEVDDKQIEIIKGYAQEDCLLPYSSFFDNVDYLEYKYDDANYYGKIIDYLDVDIDTSSDIGYVKNSDWIDSVKYKVRDSDSCIFNTNDISTSFPPKVNEKGFDGNTEWGKISNPQYYNDVEYNEKITGTYDIGDENWQIDEYVKIDEWRQNLETIKDTKIYDSASCYKLYNIILKRQDETQITNDIIKVKIYEVINMFTYDQTIIEPAIADFNLYGKGILRENVYLKTNTMYKIVPYEGNGWNGGSFTIYGVDFVEPSNPYIIQEESTVFNRQPPIYKYLYVYPVRQYAISGFLDYTLEMNYFD